MPDAGSSNGGAELAAERRRVVEAMLELVAERGYAATTVRQVLERAGVSRVDFKRLFTGKQDCFLQVYGEVSERFSKHVFAAFESEREWRDGLRAAAYAAARWIRDHPREARYGVIEMVAAGEFAQARRETTLRRFVDLVDSGREQLDRPDSVSRSMAEGVIGGTLGMLTKNLRHGARGRAEDLVPDLMFMAVRPYLGHEAAHEELSIPPPSEPDLAPVAEGT
ncbi:MAG TPA: TetR/AcrR family transcriptional regulator [Solirubrobacterales bacterium]